MALKRIGLASLSLEEWIKKFVETTRLSIMQSRTSLTIPNARTIFSIFYAPFSMNPRLVFEILNRSAIISIHQGLYGITLLLRLREYSHAREIEVVRY